MSEMTLYRVGEWSEEGNGFPIFCDDHDPVHGPLAYFPLAIDAKHVCDKLNLTAQLAEQPRDEPVAVVGDTYTLHWIGSGPIAPLIERHGIKKGDKLYTAQPKPEQAVACGCPCEPSGSDGLRCPGRDGKLLCDPEHKPEQAVGDGVDQAEFKRGYDHAVQHMADIWMDPAVRELRVVAVDMRHYLTRIGETMNSAMREKWGDTIEQADKRVSSALAGLREAIATPRPAVATPSCMTCNGRGEIGGFVSMDSGHQTDPCPNCATPAEVTDEMVIRAREAYLSSPDGVNPMRSAIEAALTAQCQVRKDGEVVSVAQDGAVQRSIREGFNPAFDHPKTAAEAVAVLDAWSDPLVMTFSEAKAKRCADALRSVVASYGRLAGVQIPVTSSGEVTAQEVINGFHDELHDVFVDCNGEITESAIRNALERSISKAGKFPVADFEIEGGLLTQEQRATLVRRAKAAQRESSSTPEPYTAEVVAEVVRGENGENKLSFVIEGGVDALEPGAVLYDIGGLPMPDDGATELYASPSAGAVVPEGWQDISTAPNDGTPHVRGLHVYAPDGTYLYWEEVAGHIDTEDGAFYSEGDVSGWAADDFTHWHPLAAAPEVTKP